MLLGYNRTARTSDFFKETMYHEYGHAAHYQGLPGNARGDYWSANLRRILYNSVRNINPPYGNNDGNVSTKRCAIIEMWENNIGGYLADLQYGEENFWASRFTDAEDMEANRFVYKRLEAWDPNTSRADFRGLADGLFWDLMGDTLRSV